jgi:hypothetical protein
MHQIQHVCCSVNAKLTYSATIQAVPLYLVLKSRVKCRLSCHKSEQFQVFHSNLDVKHCFETSKQIWLQREYSYWHVGLQVHWYVGKSGKFKFVSYFLVKTCNIIIESESKSGLLKNKSLMIGSGIKCLKK